VQPSTSSALQWHIISDVPLIFTWCSAAAAPLGSEDIFLTNSREDNATARTAQLLALPPSLAAERLAVLLQPLAGENVSPLTSMALLEVVAAIAVGKYLFYECILLLLYCMCCD
jgi:hypothetical protein